MARFAGLFFRSFRSTSGPSPSPFLPWHFSLGMVVLGYADTTSVTMTEMEHHVRAAARAKQKQ